MKRALQSACWNLAAILAACGMLAGLAGCARSEAAKVTPEDAAKLYGAYILRTFPMRTIEGEYVLTERPMPGLWDALGAQIFSASELIDGKPSPRTPVFCVNGRILPFGSSFSGTGPMSGVVRGDAFYYTYAFGSSPHRSHVARLIVVDRLPQLHEVGSFVGQDVFVENSGKTVRVLTGKYRGFNDWQSGNEIGHIDLDERARLRVISPTGTEVTPNQSAGKVPKPTPIVTPRTGPWKK